jgi:hypothetical protein
MSPTSVPKYVAILLRGTVAVVGFMLEPRFIATAKGQENFYILTLCIPP